MKIRKVRIVTRATASLAAMIMISAQETTPGQAFSKAAFTSSTTSNDLSEFILERASFSPTMFGVSSSSKEASQPCNTQRENKLLLACRIETYMCRVFYINETIVELKAHDGGNTSRFPNHGLHHLVSHYCFRFWTCFSVKPWSESLCGRHCH